MESKRFEKVKVILIIIFLCLLCCGPLYVPKLYVYVYASIRAEKNAQHEFIKSYNFVAETVSATKLFESKPENTFEKGDGKYVKKECFMADSELIFGKDQSFDEIIQEYNNQLNNEEFTTMAESNPNMPADRDIHSYFSSMLVISIYQLSKTDLEKMDLTSEYSTNYIIKIGYKYPSIAECDLMGY